MKNPLEELELVFALPDHRTLHSCREPAIINFRPDYFSPQEYTHLLEKKAVIETEFGTYRKRYDFPILSRRITEIIANATPNMIPSLYARVIIYEKV